MAQKPPQSPALFNERMRLWIHDRDTVSARGSIWNLLGERLKALLN